MGGNTALTDQIKLGTRRGKKTYAFNEGHDSTKPTRMWFQKSKEGLILFVVFFTQACRWSRCLGCNLPSTCSQYPVSWRELLKQIDYVFADPEVKEKRLDIRKVIISNNGSVLDQETFSSMALMYLVVQLNLHLPNLAILSIETRADYVELEELEFLSRGIKEGDSPTNLELAIGFEAFDDTIRNNIYQKGLTKQQFEEFVDELARYGFRLKCYFMQKPVPDMTDEEAVQDIRNAIKYLADLSNRYLDKQGKRHIGIGMHLNPTYVAHGTILETAFQNGRYQPPSLRDVARAALAAENTPIEIFIGLSDEGLAVPGGSFRSNGNMRAIRQLEHFNQIQNFGILRLFNT